MFRQEVTGIRQNYDKNGSAFASYMYSYYQFLMISRHNLAQKSFRHVANCQLVTNSFEVLTIYYSVFKSPLPYLCCFKATIEY